MSCTCNTQNQTKTLKCFNSKCDKQIVIEMTNSEKEAVCPVHGMGLTVHKDIKMLCIKM